MKNSLALLSDQPLNFIFLFIECSHESLLNAFSA